MSQHPEEDRDGEGEEQFHPDYQVMRLLNGAWGLFYEGRQILGSDEVLRLKECANTNISGSAVVLERADGKVCVYRNDQQSGGWFDEITRIEEQFYDGREEPVLEVRASRKVGDDAGSYIMLDGKESGPFAGVFYVETETPDPAFIVSRDGKEHLLVNGRLYAGFEQVDKWGYDREGEEVVYTAKVDGKEVLVRDDTIDSGPYDHVHYVGRYQGKNVCIARDAPDGWEYIVWGDEAVTQEHPEIGQADLEGDTVTFTTPPYAPENTHTITLE